MVKKSDDQLTGMKEICSYENRSEATVLAWIRGQRYPASKIGGGIWVSSKAAADKWRRDRAEGKPLPDVENRKKKKESSKKAAA